ncbi:MAG: 2-hydroxychromene-2-carboxylate isomerase/DsbA-like thioredoxin domain [uncultured Rubrobacteraceae bacterium]|uniref:2-hydroxychromene-2-carboxylate isomerase/DsbA-like thioredoxin domain n=1 Tax=uncultured Rubrobacteraceae bacterium TaxID=349277 RepID=A0A6J4RI70_9ACTN|nr:MAG: 2-hydroxychromene-2-carboxylate isomerase/DsbA-like thioredoxin domain [uncultured Rubrobacteraceae bacterium]
MSDRPAGFASRRESRVLLGSKPASRMTTAARYSRSGFGDHGYPEPAFAGRTQACPWLVPREDPAFSEHGVEVRAGRRGIERPGRRGVYSPLPDVSEPAVGAFWIQTKEGFMVVDVYADVVCPWCYVGERRLERALALRPGLEVELRWRPFQLQPGMPEGGIPWDVYARRKFGGEANARGAFAHVGAVGEGDGIRFDFGRVASAPNTVDAHRLILYAGESGRGAQWKLADALFEAYFANGRDLNDREQLAEVAAGIGLDADEVLGYLAGDGGKAEVRASQEDAYARGIQGVPFYAFDGGLSVSGAQPVEAFLKALDGA